MSTEAKPLRLLGTHWSDPSRWHELVDSMGTKAALEDVRQAIRAEALEEAARAIEEAFEVDLDVAPADVVRALKTKQPDLTAPTLAEAQALEEAGDAREENQTLRDYISASESTASCSCGDCSLCWAIANGVALLKRYEVRDHARRVQMALGVDHG